MSKIYDFLKASGVFYVLTLNGDLPAGRPFGAVMEYNDDLYISTADTKEVYRQLKENSNIQIISLKPNTREWIRIDGIAKECEDGISTPLSSRTNDFELLEKLCKEY